jgi:hypothetical protein
MILHTNYTVKLLLNPKVQELISVSEKCLLIVAQYFMSVRLISLSERKTSMQNSLDTNSVIK